MTFFHHHQLHLHHYPARYVDYQYIFSISDKVVFSAVVIAVCAHLYSEARKLEPLAYFDTVSKYLDLDKQTIVLSNRHEATVYLYGFVCMFFTDLHVLPLLSMSTSDLEGKECAPYLHPHPSLHRI